MKARYIGIIALAVAFTLGAMLFNGCGQDKEKFVCVNTANGPLYIPKTSHYKETTSKPVSCTTSTSDEKTSPVYERTNKSGSVDNGSASGEKANLATKGAPYLSLDEMTAKSGTVKGTAEYLSQGAIPLLIFGGILIVAGIVCWLWLKMSGLGFALVIAGASLIAISFYPWLVLLPVGVGMLALAYFMYTHYIHVTAATQVISNGEDLKDLLGKDTTIGAIVGNTATLLAEKEAQIKTRILELFNMAQANQTPATKAVVDKVQG